MSRWHRITSWYEKNEWWIASASLVAGFIFDAFTLRRADLPFENIWVISRIIIAAACILALNIIEKDPVNEEVPGRIHFWIILALQFSFGGIFSSFLVLYFKSGSVGASWPFLLMLAAMVVGNEFFKKRYARTVFQSVILFLSLFIFSSYALPVLLRRIGDEIFALGGLMSLAAMLLYVRLLKFAARERYEKSRIGLYGSIIGTFALMNVFYFLNVIPPLPLSLQDSGVYHSISRNETGDYVGLREDHTWLERLVGETVHKPKGDPLHVYTAVFAPKDIRTVITHVWQRWDEAKREWITASRIELPVIGGRDGGFRTYSSKSSVPEGKWRVSVETSTGQVISRIRFFVENASERPALQTKNIK